MILTVSLESVEKRMAEIRAEGATYIPWSYERSANHQHAFGAASYREILRQEREIANYFEAELRATYPDRSFVICNLPFYAVSFYQPSEDAPITDDLLPETRPETVVCYPCRKRQPYRVLSEPDPEFPQIEWGACAVCSSEVVVRSADIRRLIRPGQ